MSPFKLIALLLLMLILTACNSSDEATLVPETAATQQSESVAVEETPSEISTNTPVPATATPKPTEVVIETATATQESTSTSTPNENSADANVIFVRVVETSPSIYTFHVTVEHPDLGWDDYADGWDVVLPDDQVVKANADDPFTRLLLHPHETEQPFTRSQSNIAIDASITFVTVRAHDIVDGFGGEEVIVDLTKAEGDRFQIER